MLHKIAIIADTAGVCVVHRAKPDFLLRLCSKLRALLAPCVGEMEQELVASMKAQTKKRLLRMYTHMMAKSDGHLAQRWPTLLTRPTPIIPLVQYLAPFRLGKARSLRSSCASHGTRIKHPTCLESPVGNVIGCLALKWTKSSTFSSTDHRVSSTVTAVSLPGVVGLVERLQWFERMPFPSGRGLCSLSWQSWRNGNLTLFVEKMGSCTNYMTATLKEFKPTQSVSSLLL